MPNVKQVKKPKRGCDRAIPQHKYLLVGKSDDGYKIYRCADCTKTVHIKTEAY